MNLCPQSVLKHSVVHFQGIGMKFRRFFFKIFLSKYVEKWDFEKVWIRAWQGVDQGIGMRFILFCCADFSIFFMCFLFFVFSVVFSFAHFLFVSLFLLCVFFISFVFYFAYFLFFVVFFNFRFGLFFLFFCLFFNWGLGWVLFFLLICFFGPFIFLSFYRSCL